MTLIFYAQPKTSGGKHAERHLLDRAGWVQVHKAAHGRQRPSKKSESHVPVSSTWKREQKSYSKHVSHHTQQL